MKVAQVLRLSVWLLGGRGGQRSPLWPMVYALALAGAFRFMATQPGEWQELSQRRGSLVAEEPESFDQYQRTTFLLLAQALLFVFLLVLQLRRQRRGAAEFLSLPPITRRAHLAFAAAFDGLIPATTAAVVVALAPPGHRGTALGAALVALAGAFMVSTPGHPLRQFNLLWSRASAGLVLLSMFVLVILPGPGWIFAGVIAAALAGFAIVGAADIDHETDAASATTDPRSSPGASLARSRWDSGWVGLFRLLTAHSGLVYAYTSLLLISFVQALLRPADSRILAGFALVPTLMVAVAVGACLCGATAQVLALQPIASARVRTILIVAILVAGVTAPTLQFGKFSYASDRVLERHFLARGSVYSLVESRQEPLANEILRGSWGDMAGLFAGAPPDAIVRSRRPSGMVGFAPAPWLISAYRW